MQGGTLMHHAASPPETLPPLIIQALAQGREQHGNEIATVRLQLRAPFLDVLSADIMGVRPTTMHENARSALECGSEAAALNSSEKAVADATALQGAFGTTIFIAAKNLRSSLRVNSPRSEAWTLMGSIGRLKSENLALLRGMRTRARLLVSLACALWLLWAVLPLAAQRAVPSGQDAEFFDAYRRSDPITKWPLKETVYQIPELYGVKPATDQSQLPEILRRVSANLKKFVVDFVDTTCLETVEETGNLPRGRVGPDGWGDERAYEGTTGRTVQKFRYLMLARREGSAFTLVELRTDLRGREAPTQKLLSKQYVKTTGFAAMPLFFGQLQQPWSDFRLLGQQKIGRDRTEVVAFAEHAEPVAVMGHFLIGGTSVPLLVQGVAWIRTSDYQILQMRTDLLAPVPPLIGMTTVVHFAETQFQDSPTALWLPKEVEVTVKYGQLTLTNRHRYSHYQMFRVKSVIKTDFPAAQQH
jgi:hypothetical protein